jgi:hypothetical protein
MIPVLCRGMRDQIGRQIIVIVIYVKHLLMIRIRWSAVKPWKITNPEATEKAVRDGVAFRKVLNA